MGKRAKIHHYVPQALQRRFLDENGQIWFSERDENGQFGQPEPRNTRSTFKQRDYYTISQRGTLSDAVEKDFYGELDNFLGDFIEQVHAALDNGSVPRVQGDALDSIRKVVYHLVVRTPEFVKDIDDYEVGRELLLETIRRSKEAAIHESHIAELERRLRTAHEVRNAGRDARVLGQASRSLRIENELEEFSIKFVTSNTKSSFILTSQVAYRIGNGGSNGIANPRMEIWLPISPKRAIVLVGDSDNSIPDLIEEPRDHLRSVNSHAVTNAKQIASHSGRLLKSLISPK